MSEQNEIDARLAKLVAKYKDARHIDLKSFALFDLLPMLRLMNAQYAEAFAAAEENFDTVFASLGGSGDDHLLEMTEDLVGAYNVFIDRVLVSAGFLVEESEGLFKPTDRFPADLQEEFRTLGERVVEWMDALADARTGGDPGEGDGDEEDDADDDADSDDAPTAQLKVISGAGESDEHTDENDGDGGNDG